MIDTSDVVRRFAAAGLARWAEVVPAQLHKVLHERPHGDWPSWHAAIDNLPTLGGGEIDESNPAVTVGNVINKYIRTRMTSDVDTHVTSKYDIKKRIGKGRKGKGRRGGKGRERNRDRKEREGKGRKRKKERNGGKGKEKESKGKQHGKE